jgi:hypothetical protein
MGLILSSNSVVPTYIILHPYSRVRALASVYVAY